VVQVAGGAVVEVVGRAVVEVACGGAGGQPAEAAVPGQWARTAWGLSFLGNSFRRELKVPLGAYPLRGSTHALGEGYFVGTVLPRGLHREQTLGEGFGERKGSFAEKNPTLSEDLESYSDDDQRHQDLIQGWGKGAAWMVMELRRMVGSSHIL
jgi:hypothetical protein